MRYRNLKQGGVKYALLLGGIMAMHGGWGVAATVDLNQSILNGNALLADNGTDGWTNLQIQANNADEMVFYMEASPTAVDESIIRFRVVPENFKIDTVRVGFEKINGEFVNPAPLPVIWTAFSIGSSDGGVFVSVDQNNPALSVPGDAGMPNTGKKVEAVIPVSGTLVNTSVTFSLDFGGWTGFNDPRSDWKLFIDLNEDSPTPPAAVPLPPALLLFGSAMIGMVGVSRKGRK